MRKTFKKFPKGVTQLSTQRRQIATTPVQAHARPHCLPRPGAPPQGGNAAQAGSPAGSRSLDSEVGHACHVAGHVLLVRLEGASTDLEEFGVTPEALHLILAAIAVARTERNANPRPSSSKRKQASSSTSTTRFTEPRKPGESSRPAREKPASCSGLSGWGLCCVQRLEFGAMRDGPRAGSELSSQVRSWAQSDS